MDALESGDVMPAQLLSQRQVRFWILTFAGFFLALYVLRDVLLPFVAGLAVAYLLDPVADRLERFGLSRLAATLLMIGLFVLAVLLAAVTLLPVLATQTTAFLAKLPTYAHELQAMVQRYVPSLLEKIGDGAQQPDIQKWFGEIAGKAATWLGTVLQTLLSGGKAVIDVFSLLLVTPVVAFYVLVDWDRMIERIDSWLPRRQLGTIRAIASDIDSAIAGYVRGQSMICLALATIYGVGLTIVGLNYGLLIGIGAGILSFIPFVGSLGGLIIALAVALVQFLPNYMPIAAVVAVFAVGQFLEGNILSPKLVGNAVGLHPVWLMFALFAFGTLAGFVGLLVAVPIAAAIGVLARHFLGLYLASPYFGDMTSGEP